MKSLVVAFCLVLLVSRSQQNLDLDRLPLNTVAELGTEVVLQCGVSDSSVGHSLQWFEFAYTPGGGLISDNGVVLPGHPQATRYSIITAVPGRYDLHIQDARFEDGGTYLCVDTQTVLPNKRQHACGLTVLRAEPNCTASIGESGVIIEGSYNSNDCILDYQGGLIPNISWSGIGPFTQAYVATDRQVWGGMHFNATRNMEGRAHQSLVYFSDYFHPVDANSADNVPGYMKSFEGRNMLIRWGPTDLQANPIKDSYEPGEEIICTADANPNATINWANMNAIEIILGDTLKIEESWRGLTQTFRCQARNEIEGTVYAPNIFIDVYVPPLTSPTTTTPTTTTTTAPAVSECGDLTGAWYSTSPTIAAACIRLDLESNGLLTGLLRNHTDTYWVDIIGRAQANRFDQVGFNGIWPFDIGVSSFIGECHRCFGEEQLLINVMSRSVSDTCGVKGETRYTSQYVFTRTNAIVCPNLLVGI